MEPSSSTCSSRRPTRNCARNATNSMRGDPMKPVALAALVAAALLVGHLQLTAAEIARLRHQVSVYADEKGVGLKLPEGVACDGKGRLVVGDTGNDRVLRFTYQDKAVSGGSEIKI